MAGKMYKAYLEYKEKTENDTSESFENLGLIEWYERAKGSTRLNIGTAKNFSGGLHQFDGVYEMPDGKIVEVYSHQIFAQVYTWKNKEDYDAHEKAMPF